VQRDTGFLRYFDSAFDGDLPIAAPLPDRPLREPQEAAKLSATADSRDCGFDGRGWLLEAGVSHTTQYSHPTLERKEIILPRAAHSASMVPRVQSAILSLSDHQRAAGQRLRRLIQLLELDFVEAAKIMGVTKHVLNHWMKGNHPIQPYPLYKLCRSRGVNFDYVFLGDWSGLPYRLARELEAELDPDQPEAVQAVPGLKDA
jgi:transcriptional regulator with XRE-family HTH domain